MCEKQLIVVVFVIDGVQMFGGGCRNAVHNDVDLSRNRIVVHLQMRIVWKHLRQFLIVDFVILLN